MNSSIVLLLKHNQQNKIKTFLYANTSENKTNKIRLSITLLQKKID